MQHIALVEIYIALDPLSNATYLYFSFPIMQKMPSEKKSIDLLTNLDFKSFIKIGFTRSLGV